MTDTATADRVNESVGAAMRHALELGETGIQVAAYRHGELLVDLSAGIADPATGAPVRPDTLFHVFSVSKAVTATAVHVLAAREALDYSAPVARYWPEFGANGKGRITVQTLLSHRAGIPWMPDGVTPRLQADWAWMIRRIEALAPAFPPDTTNCYHALVWGWVVGELVHRADPEHRDFRTFVTEELFAPLGIEDIHFGLPEDAVHRRAPVLGGEPPDSASGEHFLGMPRAVYPGAAAFNLPETLRAVHPGAGGVATARAMARFFAMLAQRGELDGVRVLPARLVDRFCTPRENMAGPDRYLGKPAPIGAYGYWRGGAGAHPVVGEHPALLYHPGAGGSIAWAELDTGLSVAICHNGMHPGAVDPDRHPFVPIADAVRRLCRTS
ncbi:serine hydrolase domain-containing protein [Sciscionella marina]|uniref:serine hydrolase domain-containing protein n=1 Tax=Sciscionella marina TaxID=508770 RepID=UPI000360430D|nr:serine hydrolase domain-containing protein [Sciscionella marina]